MPAFQYHPDVLENFPNIRAAVVLATNIKNERTTEKLKEVFFGEQQITFARIGEAPLSELPSLSAWRNTFRAFGVNPTKYRSAPEALLRRLTKKGEIPSINTLVDICNLVSIRYAIAVAAFDTRAISELVTVRYAEGDEKFLPLGEVNVENPDKGEIIFVDDKDVVIARRWCWRQSEASAANLTTEDVIFTIEALHEKAEYDVEAALNDLQFMLSEYAQGNYRSDFLSPENPKIG